MTKFVTRTLIPLITAVAGLLTAFSFKLGSVNAEHQESIGKVVIAIAKECRNGIN